jgi:hypothetical protein
MVVRVSGVSGLKGFRSFRGFKITKEIDFALVSLKSFRFQGFQV